MKLNARPFDWHERSWATKFDSQAQTISSPQRGLKKDSKDGALYVAMRTEPVMGAFLRSVDGACAAVVTDCDPVDCSRRH